MSIGEVFGPDLLIVLILAIGLPAAVVAVVVVVVVRHSRSRRRISEGGRPGRRVGADKRVEARVTGWSWRRRLGVFVGIPVVAAALVVGSVHREATIHQVSNVTTPSLTDYEACLHLTEVDDALDAGHYPTSAALDNLFGFGRLATHARLKSGIARMKEGYSQMLREQSDGVSTTPGLAVFVSGNAQARKECDTLVFPSGFG